MSRRVTPPPMNVTWLAGLLVWRFPRLAWRRWQGVVDLKIIWQRSLYMRRVGHDRQRHIGKKISWHSWWPLSAVSIPWIAFLVVMITLWYVSEVFTGGSTNMHTISSLFSKWQYDVSLDGQGYTGPNRQSSSQKHFSCWCCLPFWL